MADDKTFFDPHAPTPTGAAGVERKGAEKQVGVGNRKPTAPADEKSKVESSKKLSSKPLFKSDDHKGEVWTSKEGSDDKTYASVLEYKASGEALSASADLEKMKVKLSVVEAKAEIKVLHGQVDLVDKIKHLLGEADPQPGTPDGAAIPPPMAARVGDLTAHGFPLVGGPGSPNVFIGGMPAWRVGLDIQICPAYHGPGVASPGAPTVFINGAPAARAGDFILEPSGGPNMIAVGCSTVFIGSMGSPPQPPAPAPVHEEPWVIFESVAEGNIGSGSANVSAVAEADIAKGKGKAELQGGVMAAVAKGELPIKIRLRIPFTSYYAGLGVKVEGTLLSAGAEAGVGAKVNDGKTLFEATGGAKVGAGLGGVGAKATFDVSEK